LQRVRDLDLWSVATCRAGEATGAVRQRLADADLDIPLLVDAERRPLGWLSERGLTGERVRTELRSPAEPVVELDDILRDALSDLLAHESMYGPVVDPAGHVVGALSIQAISHALGGTAAEVPGPAERVEAAREAHAES
ncbi:MAG: ABC transporter ATP-binding protein, partial [Actinobacteria bacterium]|nr:ABC transporter ATP-binding protein [Actinomycetota bacterium]